MSGIIPEGSISKTFLLPDILKNRKSLGLILDREHSSQLSFELMQEGHKLLEDTAKIEIVFFSQDLNPPFLIPPAAIFHIIDMYQYRGSVLASSIEAVIDARRCPLVDKIIWYVYNPHEMSQYSQEELKELLDDERVIKICRSEHYIPILKNISSDTKNLRKDILKHPDLSVLMKLIQE